MAQNIYILLDCNDRCIQQFRSSNSSVFCLQLPHRQIKRGTVLSARRCMRVNEWWTWMALHWRPLSVGCSGWNPEVINPLWIYLFSWVEAWSILTAHAVIRQVKSLSPGKFKQIDKIKPMLIAKNKIKKVLEKKLALYEMIVLYNFSAKSKCKLDNMYSSAWSSHLDLKNESSKHWTSKEMERYSKPSK